MIWELFYSYYERSKSTPMQKYKKLVATKKAWKNYYHNHKDLEYTNVRSWKQKWKVNAVIPAASILPSRMLVFASLQVWPWYYQEPVQVGYQHPDEILSKNLNEVLIWCLLPG